MTEWAVQRVRTFTPAIVLIAVAAACWAITASRMQGMDMGPGTDLGGFGWFAGVWATMMAAMMLPSLVPMASAYARRARGARASSPTVETVLFACGYLLVWVGAGALAYLVIDAVSALDPSWLAWDEAGPYVAGGVILLAALYELTPAKATCLRHCRDPELLTRRWRTGPAGAVRAGLEQGGYCVGSSWALMAALFALGVMSVTWMILVAVLIGLEKLLPSERVAIGTTLVVVAVLGLAVALAPDQVPGLTIPG
jgi:predicted metal-binding membrane protein